MMALIVEKFVSICFLTFYIPQTVEPAVTSPYTLPLDGPGCVNNALKKLTQCVNALKNLTL